MACFLLLTIITNLIIIVMHCEPLINFEFSVTAKPLRLLRFTHSKSCVIIAWFWSKKIIIGYFTKYCNLCGYLHWAWGQPRDRGIPSRALSRRCLRHHTTTLITCNNIMGLFTREATRVLGTEMGAARCSHGKRQLTILSILTVNFH